MYITCIGLVICTSHIYFTKFVGCKLYIVILKKCDFVNLILA